MGKGIKKDYAFCLLMEAKPRVGVVGDINLDIIAFHRDLPGLGGESIAGRASLAPGGSAANVAHALAVLGVDVLLVGCVGDDAVGEMLVEELSKKGVDTTLIQRTSREPTGVTYVAVVEGERTMLAFRGANKYMEYSKIDITTLAGAELIHVSGYSLAEGSQREATARLLEEIRGDITRTLDLCRPLAELNKHEITKTLSSFNYVFMNTNEFNIIRGSVGLGSVEQLAEELGCIIVLKKGRLGCEVTTPDGDSIAIDSYESSSVDSTGAGDAFVAGFIYELLRGSSLRRCGETASKLGALAASVIGGRIPDDVKRIL